ncbi:deoxyribose-phosphate aldolase [Bacteroidia bacterium]|nr:deoxyribose-phosphate aldolase [Bacteroidia bacterium]
MDTSKLKNLPYKEEQLRPLIKSFIDLTTLEGSDTDEKVVALCEKAKLHKTAAICVYPPFAKLVRKQLADTGIKTACVAGAFPAGQSPVEIKVAEVKWTVEQGAEEIDMVISRGKFLEEKYDEVGQEIAAIKNACGNAELKVILETGELKTSELIAKASQIAIDNGADFIKTSTGKIPVAATPEAIYTMCEVAKAHFDKNGKKVGIKAAGGVSNYEDAVLYLRIVYTLLGEEWLSPKLFRFGASRLVENV